MEYSWAPIPIKGQSGWIKWQAVKHLHLNNCNWACWTFTLCFWKFQVLPYCTVHLPPPITTKTSETKSSRHTCAKIPLTVCLWEAWKKKEAKSPKAFVDCEWPREMSPEKHDLSVQLPQDETATQQVSLKRNTNLRIPGDNFITGKTKKQVVP